MPGQKQEADRRGRTGRIIVPALPLVLCREKNIRGGDCIGRVLVIEFNESDSEVFDKVMEVLQQDSKTFEMLQVKKENTISLPGLTIYLNQRKIYHDRQEIPLTTKEYNLLCLLAANRGQVLTYAQIYEKIWGCTFSGNEKVIRYHLYNLRKKLNSGSGDTFYVIRCVREVGYCFELKSNKYTKTV